MQRPGSSAVSLLFVSAVLGLGTSAQAADPVAIAEELRDRAERVETFEVEATYASPQRETLEPTSRRLFKAPDRYRSTVWHDFRHPRGIELTHEASRVEGRLVTHVPRDKRASVRDVDQPHVLFDRTLFPLLMRRVFELAEPVDAEVDDAAGELTLHWEAPDAFITHRHISATFSMEAPYEVLSLRHHDGESGVEHRVDFSDHEVLGPGIPVARTAHLRQIDPEGEVYYERVTTLREVTINEPIADSAFEIDLPVGTRVGDSVLRRRYTVGEGDGG